ncbi:MAG: tRNA lysidine(34) synthetase TilS [Planctomycetota bacterium]|jgi:tRNA(Ile)-lysidine synthase
MSGTFEQKIAAFIKSKKFLKPKSRLLLAVSGGADSTALLYVMNSMKKQRILDCSLMCTHIHHQLRGKEADKDEQFVISKCNELGVLIETRRIDVRGLAAEKKISIETAGRQLRISNLINIAKDNGCDYIATGHQMDDNAETLLQRLGRGTGYRGLGGIWPVREFEEGIHFIRPLLCTRRNEIIQYLRDENLKWRVDKTNRDTGFRRNFIRHKILPELQNTCNDDLLMILSELSKKAQQLQLLIEDNVDRLWPSIAQHKGTQVVLELESFLVQFQAIQIELVRRSLKTLGSGEKYLTQKHYNRILKLASKIATGNKLQLPNGFIVKREYQKLIFERFQKRKSTKTKSKFQEITIPGLTKFEGYLIEADLFEKKGRKVQKFFKEKDNYVEWFDFEKLNLPLTIRYRQAGDRFYPLGLAGQKRVGKFLTSARIPHDIREKLLVIGESKKIIWVWPVRISEETKVTKKTKKILQLHIKL